VESSKYLKFEDNEVEWLLEDLLDPLDFSRILEYPNDYEDWREDIPKFHGFRDSPTFHVTSFINIVLELNIFHEDVTMKMFILSFDFLEDEIFDWHAKLGRRKISSLLDFFKAFLKY
jgi:hypothetical protein